MSGGCINLFVPVGKVIAGPYVNGLFFRFQPRNNVPAFVFLLGTQFRMRFRYGSFRLCFVDIFCLKELGTASVSYVYSSLVPSNSGPVFLTTVWVGTSLLDASV